MLLRVMPLGKHDNTSNNFWGARTPKIFEGKKHIKIREISDNFRF